MEDSLVYRALPALIALAVSVSISYYLWRVYHEAQRELIRLKSAAKVIINKLYGQIVVISPACRRLTFSMQFTRYYGFPWWYRPRITVLIHLELPEDASCIRVLVKRFICSDDFKSLKLEHCQVDFEVLSPNQEAPSWKTRIRKKQ